MTREQHQTLLASALITLECLPPRDEKDLDAFEVFHKGEELILKDQHIDVNKNNQR